MQPAIEYRVEAARLYMEHVRSVDSSKRRLQSEVDELRESVYGLSGVSYSDMPGNPNAYGDAIPDGLAKVHDAISRYMTELSEWVDVIDEAHEAIGRMDDARCAELLVKHYIVGKTWERIAAEMCYNHDYVRKELREKALSDLYAVMPEEWRRNITNAMPR